MKDWNWSEDNSGEDFEDNLMPSCDYDLSEFCEDEFSRMTGCTVNCALYLKSIEQMNKMNIAINIIITRKPEHLCYGLLTESDVSFLLALNRLGIIKHLLFLDCDPVECFVHVVWR